MTVAEELTRLGGVATRAALLRVAPRNEVDAALDTGEIIRMARGRYALPRADAARAAAHALTGVLCLTSAALHWGWAVKHPPERPHVVVPRNRKITPERSRGIDLRRFPLGPDDVIDGVTSRDRTLVDCLRHLPFDEALAVADSALRDGYSASRLAALARDACGRGSGRMRHIAALASAEAANPFESVLRAIALRVSGLTVWPQVSIRAQVKGGTVFLGRVDLADVALAIILEADSFEWHGSRAALRTDAQRYNTFVCNGWLVLRFTWEDVMFEPGRVEEIIRAAVAERTTPVCSACRRPAS